MDVSENSDTPKSSILIRFSIINHPFWGTHMFGNTQMFRQNSHLHGFVRFFTINPRHWWYFSGIKPKPRGWIRNRRSWEVWKNTHQIKSEVTRVSLVSKKKSSRKVSKRFVLEAKFGPFSDPVTYSPKLESVGSSEGCLECV